MPEILLADTVRQKSEPLPLAQMKDLPVQEKERLASIA